MSAEGSPAVRGDQGLVDDPTDLSWPDYKVALTATKREIKEDDVPSMAAGVAFKIFLALAPSLLAAVAIFGLVADPERLDAYIDMLAGIVPEGGLGMLEDILADVTSGEGGGGLAITGVLGGLWAASSAAATLVKALNRAYEVGESRSFIKQRAIAFAIVFALFVSLLALIVLMVAGPQVRDLVVPDQLQGPVANIAFIAGQVAVVLIVLVLLFAFIYWIGPNRELPRWVWMSPGALLGVVGWLVASGGFTLYVQNWGNYESGAYASIGGVIVLMLWLQISMMLVLIGAEFNSEVERLKAQYQAVQSGAGMGHMDASAAVDATGMSAPVPAIPVDGTPDAPAASPVDGGVGVGAAASTPQSAAHPTEIDLTEQPMAFEARVIPARDGQQDQGKVAAAAAAAVAAAAGAVRKLRD